MRALAAFLCVVVAMWLPILAPNIVKKDYNYNFAIHEVENTYDSFTGNFSGGYDIESNLTYGKLGGDSEVDIESDYKSVDASATTVWSSSYEYAIDYSSNKHAATATKSRDGYLFGVSGSQQSYVLWHPKYDIPLEMKFLGKEAVRGLSAYKYLASYSADVTQQYRDYGFYSGQDDIVSEGRITVWIDPLSGGLVNYESEEDLYYFWQNEEVSPWKHVAGTFTSDTVSSMILRVEGFNSRSFIFDTLLPALMVLVLALLLALIAGDFVKRRHFKIDSVSAGLFAASSLFCAVVLYSWMILGDRADANNYVTPLAQPLAIFLALLLLIIALSIVYKDKVSKILKVKVVVGLLLAFGVFLLVFGLVVNFLSGLTVVCVALLELALLLAIINAQNKFLSALFKLSVFVVAVVGVLLEVLLPFKAEISASVPFFADTATPLPLILALIAIGVYRSTYENANVNLNIMTLPMRIAVSVTGVLLVLTGFTWQATKSIELAGNNKIFEDGTNQVIDQMHQAIQKQAFALTGGAGLFDASENVTKNEWTEYFNGLHPAQNIPGTKCVGYGVVWPRGDSGSLAQMLRSEDQNFAQIYPELASDDPMVVVKYVEPYNVCVSAVGYDMRSDSVRRESMDLARDLGAPVMSGKIYLIIDTAENPQSAFQMFAPIYKKGADFSTLSGRRESIQGYAIGPVVVDDFMNAVVENMSEDISVEIYDTNDANNLNQQDLMYDSDPNSNSAKPCYTRYVNFIEANHTWTIRFDSQAGCNLSGAIDYSLYISLGGIVASLLIGYIVYGVYSSRDRALRLARHMSKDLREERNNAILVKKETDAILSSMGEGVLLVDCSGKIKRLNDKAVELLGYSKGEILSEDGSKNIKTTSEEGRSYYVTKNCRALANFAIGKNGIYDKTLIRKDGTLLPSRITVSPVVLESRQLGRVLVISDITKQHQLDKAKDMFLSLATHQLKTPATAIKWYTEMLLSQEATLQKLPPVKEKIARSIDSAVKHMIYIIDNILDVSRMETGRLKLNLKHDNIKTLVDGVVDDLAMQAGSKKQHIELTYAKGMDIIAVDHQLMSQVFANIIGNAIKYSPNGSKIEVSVKQNSKNVVVTIKDQGLGIPKKQHSEVFKKFFRADNAVAREASGNGLGLYLSKAIVKANGGNITFVSVEDKGSTFTVTLPRHAHNKRTGINIGR